jgi:zinc D-Ala-D-Ala carboxypeptidase
MQLSEHLSLAEVIRSDSAKRNGISNTPTSVHLVNLGLIAANIFEPIRVHFKNPIHISSGYRSKALNDKVKGSSTSQHCKGQALDIDMDGSAHDITNTMVFNFIKEHLEFDQLIWEFGDKLNPDWVHVSFALGKNRKQVLRAVKVGGESKYIPYV